MDFAQLATSLTKQFITDTNGDGQIDMTETISSLSRLLSGSDTPFDLGGLVTQLQGSGLTDVVSSWLGDGDNLPVSGQQINDALGSDKLNDFASSLNMDSNSALDSLTKLLPQLIDKSSSGGQLNDINLGQLSDLFGSAGGLGGLGDVISNIFTNKKA